MHEISLQSFPSDTFNKALINVLDSIYDGIVIVDTNSTIVYANPSYSRILQIPVEKVLGKKVSDIEPDTKSLNVLKTLRPVLAECEILKSINKHIIINATPILNGNKLLGAIAVFRDITEVAKLNKQLSRLKSYTEKLEEKLTGKEQLPPSFKNLVGIDPCLIKILTLAANVATTEANIIIEGESGVGKGVLARAIHQASYRAKGPFVAVNCAAIPEHLFESELFGYVRGAFTGALSAGKPGKFELANGGTLFLDEVSELPLAMQPKLLRSIQDGEIDPIGATRPHQVNIRIIAATNQNLLSLTQNGAFRRDLYYRLAVIPIHIPPLRERKNDIILLAEKFLVDYSPECHLSDESASLLKEYTWPGNVRELENVIKYACIVSRDRVIKPCDFPDYINKHGSSQIPVKLGNPREANNQKSDKKVSIKVTKETILWALKKCHNNRSKAMRMLGISRGTFYKRLREYDIAIGPQYRQKMARQ